MSLELVQLGPATFHRLRELERTPGQPDPWVAEVEDFIFGPGVGSHFDEPASHILLAVDADQVVGAVVHHADDLPGAEYISAVLVDHRKRGQGYGRQLPAATIEHAIVREGLTVLERRCGARGYCGRGRRDCLRGDDDRRRRGADDGACTATPCKEHRRDDRSHQPHEALRPTRRRR